MAARDARNERHGLAPKSGQVIPIGTWADAAVRSSEHGYAARQLVFVANLVERMGGRTVIEALGELARRGSRCCEIAGHGPEEAALRARHASWSSTAA